MEISEFRNLVANSPSREWFNNVEIELDYPAVGLKQKFSGLSSLYKFFVDQVNGWEKLVESLPTELSNSRQHFTQNRNKLSQFINSFNQQDRENVERQWNQARGSFIARYPDFITSNSPELKFLLSVHEKQPDYFSGAYHFLIGKSNFNNMDNIVGSLLGYEFRRTEYPKLKYRKLGEIESFKEIRSRIEQQVADSESHLSKHLADAVNAYEEYTKNLDAFKEESEQTFSRWFTETTEAFEEFNTGSKNKIQELEDTFKNKLQLEKPAEYWSSLASKHRCQGWWAFAFFVFFVVLVVAVLGVLLWKPPNEIFVSFFQEDKSAAIRWSIIFITLISFMAFCIRAISKVMFSSFHLSRDCQERHTLTYFYLALSKDAEIPAEERLLIMQSLFSRADTGLLAEDGSPTLPNDFAGKLFGK